MEKSKTYEQLRDEAAACGQPGARLRDVAYAILAHTLKSKKIAYAVAFPNEPAEDAAAYVSSPLQKVLAKRVKMLFEGDKPEGRTSRKTEPKNAAEAPKTPQTDAQNADEITADENRAEIMASIHRLEQMKDDPSLDLTAKDRIAIEKQLLQSRTALKEKFEVSKSAEDQLIIVQPKYNHVCEQTGRECWLQTKEYAMQRWNLKEA